MEGIIIDKTGVAKNIQMKEHTMEYYAKKCGYKATKGFELQTTWKVKMKGIQYHINLYAKTNGRANSENKYDFPPPVDNVLYFGSCLLVGHDDDDEPTSLTLDEWEKIYEKLFGGFEDLTQTVEEDENEEDELDLINNEHKTKEGYLKDGFVVDDCIEDDSYEDSELSEEAYVFSDEN